MTGMGARNDIEGRLLREGFGMTGMGARNDIEGRLWNGRGGRLGWQGEGVAS